MVDAFTVFTGSCLQTQLTCMSLGWLVEGEQEYYLVMFADTADMQQLRMAGGRGAGILPGHVRRHS